MKPVDQTRFGDEEGNCFQACLASVLEIPLDKVPDFCSMYSEDNWHSEVQDWLMRFYGMSMLCVKCPVGNVLRGLTFIAAGLSERFVEHAVIMRDGKVIHDPHPSRTGLQQVNEAHVFLTADPARLTSVQEMCPRYRLSEFGTSEARKRLADEETYPMLRRLVQDLDRQLATEREKNERLMTVYAAATSLLSFLKGKHPDIESDGWTCPHMAALDEAIAAAQEPRP